MTVMKKKNRGRMENGTPNPIDVHVGNRIRLRRSILGYSQEKLSQLLGLTFQQIQKYETGANRVGASRLWDIGNVLGVSMDFFFEDLDKETADKSPRMLSVPASDSLMCAAEEAEKIDLDPMKRQETLELVNAYYKINNRKLARQLLDLIVNMSKNNPCLPDYRPNNNNND